MDTSAVGLRKFFMDEENSEKMKAKFKVSSHEQSERLQKKLFEMGCEWVIGGRSLSLIDKPYLFLNSGRITFMGSYRYEDFQKHDSPELDTERFLRGEYEWNEYDGGWYEINHDTVKNYDYINPDHYKSGSKEVIEMMVDIWGAEAVALHCEMCAFKYRMRLSKKPDQPIDRDIEKAKWYESKANELRE